MQLRPPAGRASPCSPAAPRSRSPLRRAPTRSPRSTAPASSPSTSPAPSRSCSPATGRQGESSTAPTTTIDAADVKTIEVLEDPAGTEANTVDLSAVDSTAYTQLTSTLIKAAGGADTLTGTQLDDRIEGAQAERHDERQGRRRHARLEQRRRQRRDERRRRHRHDREQRRRHRLGRGRRDLHGRDRRQALPVQAHLDGPVHARRGRRGEVRQQPQGRRRTSSPRSTRPSRSRASP